MYSLLLALIYLAFISLGLPDALLGSAWPAMYPLLDVPVSYAGIVAMIIAGGTIISSLNVSRLVSRLGTRLVTTVSVLTTAVALFGFSFSGSFWMLCLWAVPYGLGAGSVDAALNNFVAIHYAARHMNWLHCFWGVGASIGPYIMSYSLVSIHGWPGGYRTVGFLQSFLTIILLLSLPIWKKREVPDQGSHVIQHKHLKIKAAIKIRGVKQVLAAFFAYCALETTMGLWASTYLVLQRGVAVDKAARWASMFYLGITIGRLASGFAADKLGNRKMIRIGLATISIGLLTVMLPLRLDVLALTGLIIVGIGCAPIYPSIIHQTPRSFGAENSQAIIGIQMASAYTGSTLAPPLFGLFADFLSVSIYPFYMLFFLIIMVIMTEVAPGTKLNTGTIQH